MVGRSLDFEDPPDTGHAHDAAKINLQFGRDGPSRDGPTSAERAIACAEGILSAEHQITPVLRVLYRCGPRSHIEQLPLFLHHRPVAGIGNAGGGIDADSQVVPDRLLIRTVGLQVVGKDVRAHQDVAAWSVDIVALGSRARRPVLRHDLHDANRAGW